MTHLPVPPVCIRPRCALRMLRRRVMLGSGSRCGAAGMRAWDVGPRPARAPPSPGPAQVSVARFTWARLSDLSSMPTMLYLPHWASSAQPTPPTPTPNPHPTSHTHALTPRCSVEMDGAGSNEDDITMKLMQVRPGGDGQRGAGVRRRGACVAKGLMIECVCNVAGGWVGGCVQLRRQHAQVIPDF